MRLTDEGAHFYEEASRHLEGIGEAAARAAGSAVAIGGRLRVNIHPYFSRLVLAPKLPLFIERYPDLQLDLLSREDDGDLVGDGVDVALRSIVRISAGLASQVPAWQLT
jgi:DNA-binding transcriptional LysR family regulator